MLRTKLTTTLFLVLAASVVGFGQEPVAPPAADGDAAAQAAQYRALLAQPPEKLAELGRERAIKLLADLKYGQVMAKGEAREKNLEHTRVELLAKFDETKKAYLELRDHVEAEMEKIRQQFADDPAECDHQLLALIAIHRPRVLQLRAEGRRCKELADSTDSRLATVRQELVTISRERELLAQGHKFNRPATPRALVQLGLSSETLASFGLDEGMLKELNLDAESLGLNGLGAEIEAKPGVPVRPVSRETVDQAIEEFRELF